MSKSIILFSYPGDKEFYFLHENEAGNTQFFIAPFQKSQATSIIRGVATKINIEDFQVELTGTTPCSSTTSNEYQDAVNRAIQQLRSHTVDKVVVSAVTSYQFKPQPIAWLSEFRIRYPQAFIYLVSTPETGTWFGATPERLVVKRNDLYTTISLAGTRKSEAETIPWGQKEGLEQSIVTDYLKDRLVANGASNIRIARAETIEYGTIQHLASEITFQSDKKSEEVANILHPTPAVCGTPLNEALKLLPALEQHSRKYYTGYLGTLSDDDNADFYVNLRCMELFKDGICCYTGCGITEDSIAEDEWQETRLKLRSMVSIIEKMQKLPDILKPC